MKARETFEQIRNRKNNKFNLRVRLVMWVTGLILLNVVLTIFLLDMLESSSLAPIVRRILLIGIVLIVGSVISSLLSKYFIDPMQEIRRGMEKVADGDFTIRLETNSSMKEIQEIYSGFNLMTKELSATEVLQSDFVSNVSHEFKTPIASIEGYSMLLQGGDNLNEEQRQYVDRIMINTNRLSTLIGNVLLLSKIENQSIETNQTWYRLDEQIRESIVVMEPLWMKKEIELDVDMEDIKYLGNKVWMHHIWDNLLGNAIKFSPQGGKIRMRLNKKNGKIIYTIEDEGPGIPEEAKPHIFDKFYQADSSHKQEGNGLGLPLAKRIAMITGGEIEVDDAPGGGCRFTVTLEEKND